MPKKTSTFDRASFEKEFNKRNKQFVELRNEAEYTLKKKLELAGIKFHSIPSRIKELDSCFNKIEKYRFEKPFEQMRDFVGLRVICLFLSDIPKIDDLIKQSFFVINSDNKIEDGDNSSFGYMSVHHIVRFGNKHKGERYDNIKNIPFEIQVRTIAMDAWANISHYLDYKTEQDIPIELKRDFHALSGMFYVADKHFQLFFEQRKQRKEEIANVFEKGNKDESLAQPINLDTLIAYLANKFPKRKSPPVEKVSNYVNFLRESSFKTIGEIDEVIEKTKDAFHKFEDDNPFVFDLSKGQFSSLGVLGYSLQIYSPEHTKILLKNSRSKQIATDGMFEFY